MRGFYPARTTSVPVNLVKTFFQVVGMWGVFLFLLPMAILQVERLLGVARFVPQPWAWIVFAIAGGIGLWCGVIFVIHGKGTPLPLDETTRFVVLGPYRHVRNPMAVLGILQGVCVGLILGSPLTVAYAVAGAYVWNYLARPMEERDLLERFGEPYRHYRNSVPCWLPRMFPYQRVESCAEERKNLSPESLPPASH